MAEKRNKKYAHYRYLTAETCARIRSFLTQIRVIVIKLVRQ